MILTAPHREELKEAFMENSKVWAVCCEVRAGVTLLAEPVFVAVLEWQWPLVSRALAIPSLK